MKTLDEVLKSYEICTQEQSCSLCPYIESHTNGKWACSLCSDCTHDAFRYLKEYRDLKNIMDWHKEMEEIRKRFTNTPLTWDELKTMIGKPVWVERTEKYCVPHWAIVEDIIEWDSIYNSTLLLQPDDEELFLSDHTKTWQAYRKEQK